MPPAAGLVKRGFELKTQIRMVLSTWQSELPRLIVFDNCEEQELFEQWRPKTGAARILVTSRRQEWDLDLGVATLAIGVLEHSESIELLQKIAARLSVDDAGPIADELGDLPLTLHLAGYYLKNYADEVSPDAYLEQLKDEMLLNHDSLRERGAKRNPTKHELNVAKTFAFLIVWQPHLRFVADQALEREDETGADLCNALGYHLNAIGDYDPARPYLEQALEIRKKVLGEEHPDTATSLNNLAVLCFYENKFNEAAGHVRKALAIRKKVLGKGHPETRSSMEDLAVIEKRLE